MHIPFAFYSLGRPGTTSASRHVYHSFPVSEVDLSGELYQNALEKSRKIAWVEAVSFILFDQSSMVSSSCNWQLWRRLKPYVLDW